MGFQSPFSPIRGVICLGLILCLSCVTAAPIHIDISDWLHFPPKGDGIQGEIQCYGLPYGGIGFASHVLTYYTLICIAFSKRPLAPWKDLTHSWLDLILDIVALVGSTGLAIFTMIRCRQSWQFLLMGVWKFTLAFSAGCVYTHRSLLVRKYHPYQKVNSTIREAVSYTPLIWLIVYVGGVIVGMTGLGSLVTQNWDAEHVKTITMVFGGVAGGVVLAVAVVAFIDETSNEGLGIGIVFSMAWIVIAGIVGVGLLAAFYSDWVLGAMTGNLTGSPSSDNAMLYWGYFVAKRLPILSL